jgi:hypothetical protein
MSFSNNLPEDKQDIDDIPDFSDYIIDIACTRFKTDDPTPEQLQKIADEFSERAYDDSE